MNRILSRELLELESRYEPRHDKTNKVAVCPAKTQISLGIHPDAQSDLSLCWAHSYFVGLVMSRLICGIQ